MKLELVVLPVLEFPITVVMDLNNTPGGGGGRGALVPSALLGAGASRHPEAWSEKSASETGKIARFLEDVEVREEWERLFYVAATRAMAMGIVRNIASQITLFMNAWWKPGSAKSVW